jgi:hypothetical protein
LTLLLAARGWEGLPGPFRAAVCIVCLAGLLVSNVYYFTRWQKGNVLQAVQMLEARATPETLLIVPKYLQPLWTYYSRTGLAMVDEEEIDRLAPAVRNHTQAVMVTLDVPNPVQDALDVRFRVLERSRFPAEFNLGLVVTFYANRSGSSASD